MFDDDDRVALVHQAVEHSQQHADVLEVQSRGRLVQDVDGLARVTLRQLGGQLHALALTARQRSAGLPQLDVSQAHVLQHLYLVQNLRHVLEELHGHVDGHVQHVGNGLALVAHLQGLAVVTLAVAHLAGHVDVGQEVHLDGLVAVALASLAAAPADVERETPRLVATHLRLGQSDEQVAYVRKHTRVRGRIRTRRTSQRRLVYVDHLVYIFQPLDAPVGQRVLQRAVETLRQDGLQRLVDKGRLATARHARHADEPPQRELHIHPAQVIATRPAQPQAVAVASAAHSWHLDTALAVQVARRQRMRLQHLLRRADKDHLAPQPARLRPHVDDIIGRQHHVLVVLHHDDRVANVPQLLQRMYQPLVVPLVQADARFV